MSAELLYAVCGEDTFWDSNISWNTTDPRFSECFQVTVLSGLPVSLLLLTILAHAFTSKRITFNLAHWTFLKWARWTLIVFASLANILYSSWLTQRYYLVQYRVLLSLTIIQLLKATCFVFLTMLYFKQRLSVKSGLLWIFLVVETLFNIVIYREKWADYDAHSSFEFYFFTLYVPILILLTLLSCFNEGVNLPNLFPNQHRHLHNGTITSKPEKKLFEDKKCPKTQASFVNRVFFFWFTKLIRLGRRKPLGVEDMWQLKNNLLASTLSDNFTGKLETIERKTASTQVDVVSLSISLFKRKFMVAILLTILTDIFTLAVPILIKQFIGFIQDASEQPDWHGYLLALCLFAANITMNLLQIQLKECQQCLGLKMTATISAAIYRKALKKTQSSWRDFETGKLMNMVSVDTRRLLEFMEFFYVLVSAPFRFIVSVYLLYASLGSSALYALLIMGIWFPFNLSVIRFMKQQQSKKMEETDKRVRFVNEVLNGIKIVKLYAWEESFMEYIAKLRDSELKYLKTMAMIQASIILQSPLLPLIFSVLIFGAYMSTSPIPLTAQDIFFTLSIAATIQIPLQRFCTVIEKYTLAMVSCRRINAFLNLRDPKPYITRNRESDAIRIEEASFSWKDSTLDEVKREKGFKDSPKRSSQSSFSESLSMEWKPADLENINVQIPKGSFTAVIGPVGSGKSSFLSAILGEMNLTQGKINVDGASQIAFISQQPWCQHMTMRDNILFGKPFIKDKYDRTLSNCALSEDINILPDGDMTEIGENGINLSGGQKQRVSIARSVYSDADLFLFDDPLSAVDGPVARHLIDNVLSSRTGCLKGKTRVLVTNNLDILQEVDKIIMLDKGAIIESGTYQQLIQSEGSLARLAAKLSLKERKAKEDETKEEKSSRDMIDEEEEITDPKETKNIVENEFLESGKIDWKIYKQYFAKVPTRWFVITFTAALLWFTTLIVSNAWLAYWADKAKIDNDPWNKYIIFSSITFAQGLGLVITLIGSNIASVHSCRGLHKDLASGILLSPLSFFEKTPMGRILNRFSRDMDVVDMWIRLIICCLIIAAIDTIGALCNIAIQAPIFILVMLPLGLLFSTFPRLYMPATRQLKRLDSTTRSPIYSYIGESVSGIVTIKAYGAQNRFVDEFFHRVDTNQNTAYLSVMSILWRQMILGIFGSLLLFLVAIFGVLSKKTIGPGDIGLMLVAAQRVTESSIMCLDFIAELEVNIVCVERISEYSVLPAEGERFLGKCDPGLNWPAEGVVHFDKYSTRYRPELDKVLSDIDCKIGSGEKIGIVGRTGAGKSTISLALFRILKACEGAIRIDSCNIDEIGLHTLRSRLAIIPQDPVIFCGSLRFNLDPFDKYSDDEIWACLEHSHLKKYFEQSGAGLEFQATEGGKNLSLGQRQLICLTRALLKKSKILVLDEATAAIDMETDALVQETIRSQFSDCTILTIAHRLNTIMDSDRILVLDAGKIVEFDSPLNLMKKQDSYFHSLAKEAGLLPKS